MPFWDGPAVLAAFKREAGLNDANEYDDTLDLYPACSRGQVKLFEYVAARYPNPLYPAPFTLTPSADRKTFSFGNDSAGNAILPIGAVQIATTPKAFSGDSFSGWEEGRDFYDEGDHIRLTSDRTYSGTLYARAVLTPPDITAVQPPVINPASARSWIAVFAAREFAGEGNQNPALVDAMQRKIDDRYTGIAGLMLTYRKRYQSGGAGFDPARWWLSAPDLGSTGS